MHVYSTLDAPRGPLASRHAARFSLNLTEAQGPWEIAALHNTTEASTQPGRQGS